MPAIEPSRLPIGDSVPGIEIGIPQHWNHPCSSHHCQKSQCSDADRMTAYLEHMDSPATIDAIAVIVKLTLTIILNLVEGLSLSA